MTHFVRLLQRRAGHAALVLAAVCIGGARPAAVPTGNIAGTVRDQAGQPVPNAQVNIVGTAFNTLSDSAGAYRIVRVPEGVYSVRAAFIGYRSMEVQQVSVRPGKTTSLDFVLEMTAVHSKKITVVSSTQDTRGLTGRARTGTSRAGATRAGTHRAQPRPLPAAPVPATLPRNAGAAAAAFEGNTENYAAIEESRFLPAAATRAPRSRSTWTGVLHQRAPLPDRGQRPPKDAVRIEELSTTSATTTRSREGASPSRHDRRRRRAVGARAPAGPHRDPGEVARDRTRCRRATSSSCSTSRARCGRRTSCRW